MARKQAANAATEAVAKPTEQELAAMLGTAYPVLQAVVGVEGRTGEWRQYTRQSPWLLRVTKGKRPLCYLQPEAGAVKATVLLGPKSVVAALAGRVSRRLHPVIEAAKVYPEGRPVPVRLKRLSDVARLEELVAVKLKPEASRNR
jgi:hypothetical protein